jgi:hypothetical protein
MRTTRMPASSTALLTDSKSPLLNDKSPHNLMDDYATEATELVETYGLSVSSSQAFKLSSCP